MARYTFRELVVDSRTGLNPRKNFTLGNGSNYYITIKDIHDGKIVITEKTDRVNDDAIAIIKKRSRIKNGDILFTSIGRIGETAIVTNKDDTWDVNESVFIFTLNTDIITQEFFCALFQSKDIQDRLTRDSSGSTFKSIKMNQLEKMSFNIPDLDVQSRIVSELSKVDNLIVARKKQLTKLDELVKSRFIELFVGKGYPTKTVDEVSLGKGEYGAQSASSAYDPTRPRYVRITDINDDGTLNDDVVSSANFDDDEQYKLKYGDFMFARMGATVGKTYAFIEGNQIFAGYLIRYRLNKGLINPHYLFWYTKLDEYWNWVKLNQSGAAQPGINAKKYGSLQIPLPPIEEQNAFAAFVEQTDKSKLAIQESLAELETLKKALMQKYFG